MSETWKTQTLKQLYELKKLEADWDHEGSPPVLAHVIEHAEKVIDILADDFTSVDSNEQYEQVPFICPIAGGGIQFEWIRLVSTSPASGQQRELEVELTPDQRILWIGTMGDEESWGSGRNWEAGEVEWNNIDAIRVIIRMLFNMDKDE